MSTHLDVAGAYPSPDQPAAAPVGPQLVSTSEHSAGAVQAGEHVSTERWQRRYAATVAAVDLLIVATTVALGISVGIGRSEAADLARVDSGIVAGVVMIVALALFRAWDERLFGSGAEELKRIYRSFAASAIGLGLTGLALQIESVRLWVFLIIPLCGVLCAVARYGLRKLLHRARREQRCMLSVLAVGGEDGVGDLIRRTQRDPHFGWQVIGACTPTGAGPSKSSSIEGVPVVGDLDSVGSAVRSEGHRIVAVAPTPGWGAARLQKLAWELEGSQTELAVDPGLMEIAGPRLHITPVDGLPMLRLTQPNFTGWRRVVKSVVDRTAASMLMVVLMPVLAGIALAVRRDGGPALYLQERVGINGETFRMVKFRSMVVNAHQIVDTLADDSDGAGPLFKMRCDPRVTRVGAFLRRYSLDELPQLLNVLTGSMSLVGPRPPLPSEVATYSPDARRRLLVRPGMTGLWQVSGRSDLTWEETIRLDLRYVENWSIAVDATIICKTAGAMIRGRGAY